MADSGHTDSTWDVAVNWVLRQHEQPLDRDTLAALNAWLAQDPAHRAAYEEAAYLWLLTGLVPPSSEDDHTTPAQSCQDQ